MEKPTRKYFFKIRKWMRFSGLMLYTEIDNSDKVYLCLFPLFFYAYWGIVHSTEWDLSEKAEETMYGIALLVAASFITTARIRRRQFATLLDLLEDVDVWGKKGQDEHLEALSTFVTRVGDVTCPLGTVFFVLVLCAWFIATNGNGLPFASMPEWIINFIGYAGCFLFQAIIYLGVSHEYLMINVLKVCAMVQLLMHFKHLSMNVKDIVENAKKVYCQERGVPRSAMVNSDIPWKYFQNQMKDALTYHESLLKIAEAIETLFNRCTLFSFINVSLFICLVLYRLVDCPIFSVSFFRFTFYVLLGYVPFFIDCYLSQLIMMESVEIAYSCYQINFIGTDLRFQKMIVLLIGRWQKPVKFTIGKFAPLEIATSLTVAKASISYFMLLQNIKKI